MMYNISGKDGETTYINEKVLEEYYKMYKNVFTKVYHPSIEGGIAVLSNMDGWITGMTEKNMIIQDWAGRFSLCKTNKEAVAE